jgi:hypothetical protein
MTGQKQYRVTFYYTEGGSVIVSAASPGAAKKKMLHHLDNDGLDGLKEFKVSHREYDTVEIEEITSD